MALESKEAISESPRETKEAAASAVTGRRDEPFKDFSILGKATSWLFWIGDVHTELRIMFSLQVSLILVAEHIFFASETERSLNRFMNYEWKGSLLLWSAWIFISQTDIKDFGLKS